MRAHPIVNLIASLLIQLCLGGVYAWSTFALALQREHALTGVQTQLLFGATIATFTSVMVVAGGLLERFGPRRLVTAGGMLFAAGNLLASASAGNMAQLLFGVALVAGAGIGCGYVCPLATAVRWFPGQRGLVTGVIVAGFGAGAILLTALTTFMLGRGVPVLAWLGWLGVGYGAILILAGQLLTFPRQDCDATGPRPAPPSFRRDPHFWGMVAGMFCGTFAGLLVIGNVITVGLAWGIPLSASVLAVSLFAAGNAAGRIGWGALADRWGSQRMIPIALGIGAVGLCLWPMTAATHSTVLFLLFTALIAVSFGGCFVLFAAHVTDLYGPAHLPVIYPWVFLAYGLAALAGPLMGGWLSDVTGGHHTAAFVAAAVCGAGAITSYALSRPLPAPVTHPQLVVELRLTDPPNIGTERDGVPNCCPCLRSHETKCNILQRLGKF